MQRLINKNSLQISSLPNSRLFSCVLFVVAQFIFAVSFGQEVKIKAQLDSANVLIGDQIHLQLSAKYNPQNYRVQFPNLPDTFQHFEVIERSKMDTVIEREQSTFKQTITLTSFDSGQWKIPPQNFAIQSLKGDAPVFQQSDSFIVSVNTVAVDTAQPFKPIFGIKGATMPLSQILLYIALGILIAVLLGLLIWYLIRRAKNKPQKDNLPPLVILPPHEKAMQDLKNLEEQKLWQNQQEKAYHTQLTDIVRNYLEAQFEMDCFDKTSNEIMQQVKKLKALATSRQALRTIFETADMVKFAKSKPSAEEHEQSLELAKDMISESYKKFQSQQPSNPAS